MLRPIRKMRVRRRHVEMAGLMDGKKLGGLLLAARLVDAETAFVFALEPAPAACRLLWLSVTVAREFEAIPPAGRQKVGSHRAD